MRGAELQSTVQALSPLAKPLILVPMVKVWSKLTIQLQEHIFRTQTFCNHFLLSKLPLQGDPATQELFAALKMLLREMRQPAILLKCWSCPFNSLKIFCLCFSTLISRIPNQEQFRSVNAEGKNSRSTRQLQNSLKDPWAKRDARRQCSLHTARYGDVERVMRCWREIWGT